MDYFMLLKRTKRDKKYLEQKLNFAIKHGNLNKSKALELLNNPKKAEEYLHKGEGNI